MGHRLAAVCGTVCHLADHRLLCCVIAEDEKGSGAAAGSVFRGSKEAETVSPDMHEQVARQIKAVGNTV